METGETEVTKRAREYLSKHKVLMFLVRMAIWSTRDAQSAWDLVADTIVRVLEEKDPRWNGTRPFLSFMSFALRHVYDDLQSRFSAQEIPHDASEIDDMTRSKHLAADEAIDRRRSLLDLDARYRELWTVLDAEEHRLSRCLELWLDGVSVEEQAEILGLKTEDVYDAHEKIRRRAASIRDRWIAETDVRTGMSPQGKPGSDEVRP